MHSTVQPNALCPRTMAYAYAYALDPRAGAGAGVREKP
jgi:hypothetical protein